MIYIIDMSPHLQHREGTGKGRQGRATTMVFPMLGNLENKAGRDDYLGPDRSDFIISTSQAKGDFLI